MLVFYVSLLRITVLSVNLEAECQRRLSKLSFSMFPARLVFYLAKSNTESSNISLSAILLLSDPGALHM